MITASERDTGDKKNFYFEKEDDEDWDALQAPDDDEIKPPKDRRRRVILKPSINLS